MGRGAGPGPGPGRVLLVLVLMLVLLLLVLALVPVLVLTAVLSFAVVLPLVSGCPSGFFFFFFFFVNEIGLKSLRAWFGGAVGWWGGGVRETAFKQGSLSRNGRKSGCAVERQRGGR